MFGDSEKHDGGLENEEGSLRVLIESKVLPKTLRLILT
jgi:hypothetical protein